MTKRMQYSEPRNQPALSRSAKSLFFAAALGLAAPACSTSEPVKTDQPTVVKLKKKAPASQKASASQEFDVFEALQRVCKGQAGDEGLEILKVGESLKVKGAPEVEIRTKTDWGVIVVTKQKGVDLKMDPTTYGSLFGVLTPLLAKNPNTRREALVLVCPKSDQPEDKNTVRLALTKTHTMRDILAKSKVPVSHKKKAKLQEEVKKLQEQLKEIQGALETNGD